jgi:hypothetical protein
MHLLVFYEDRKCTNNVTMWARFNNYCSYGNAIMLSLCIVEVIFTVKSIRILKVAHQYFCGEFILPVTTKRKLVYHVKCLLFVRL